MHYTGVTSISKNANRNNEGSMLRMDPSLFWCVDDAKASKTPRRASGAVVNGSKLYFKSAGVQIVEHLKKENDSEYHFILLTDTASKIIQQAKALNPGGEFIFKTNGERLTARAVTYWLSKYCRDAGITYKSPNCTRRTTASRLSTAGMPLNMIRDILGQVDEKTTFSYIYNPNTEQENLNIMNEALKKSDKKTRK